MKFLITQLKEYIEKEEKNRSSYQKTSFWASENSNCLRQIYWTWMNQKPSNPIKISSLQIMRTGKKVEDQLIEDWDKMGILVVPPKKGEQHYIRFNKDEIVISGKLDAIIKETLNNNTTIETPVEVKSYYGDYQERKLFNLEPNESYVKQLAIYMDALKKDRGILYMVNRGNGNQFQFIVTRKSKEYEKEYEIEGISYIKTDEDEEEKMEFKCGFLSFNLNDVYNHFKEAKKYIDKKKLPPLEYQYKYPIDLEMLKKQSQTNISKARTGKKVLGDWNCLYCSYKNKCLKKQKVLLGYNDEEIMLIKKLTQGYTKKDWKNN